MTYLDREREGRAQAYRDMLTEVDRLGRRLADAEAARDYHHARADVLLAKMSGGVRLRGGKPGDYWAEWHRTHCAAAEAASNAEAGLAAVEAQLAALDELATPEVTPSEDMRAAFELAARGIRAALDSRP